MADQEENKPVLKEKTGLSGWAHRKAVGYNAAKEDMSPTPDQLMGTKAPEEYHRLVVPSKLPDSEYPLIDNDPHFKRVVGYMRPSDALVGAGMAALTPFSLALMERVSPSYAGAGGYKSVLRVSWMVGLAAGGMMAYTRSNLRFYGHSENAREVEMDMREMVAKVKKGLPLYGESTMTEYMQGVAARNSRYSGLFMFAMPWFNFVNHNQHGVDTAKYYQQAERELEAERVDREGGVVPS
ncbi:NADH:ubiquinone reductase (H(+)-translocating) [Venturia nashicola]|nr:NADH:ubiquinone reductase (H(+)-translocating) [Venturia nashicola]